MLRVSPLSLVALLAGALLLAALPAQAVREPAPEPLHGAVVAPAGFVATPVPQPLAAVASELDPLVAAAYDDFVADHGPGWRVYVDRRSAGAALAEGAGIPWVTSPGIGLADLELRARDMVRRYPGLFGAPDGQLVLDPAASGNFGEDGRFWNLIFRQRIAGVPVDGSAVVFRVSHGNLVQFGVNRVLPQAASLVSVTPALSPAAAKAALGSYIGGLLPDDLFIADGDLSWVVRGAADEIGYTGPVGAGWTPHLVYRYTFLRSGSAAGWTALVDALSGEVLRFVDANDYVSVLKASVYPSTNCADPIDCVSGSAAASAPVSGCPTRWPPSGATRRATGRGHGCARGCATWTTPATAARAPAAAVRWPTPTRSTARAPVPTLPPSPPGSSERRRAGST